jgi:hypothetical protein
MAKYIGGKKYDKDTASHLVTVDNGFDPKSEEWLYEKISFYRKRTGEMFAVKEGQILNPSQPGKVGQRGISYIVQSDPFEWTYAIEKLEAWGSAEDYEKVFGLAEEDESRRQVAAWIPVSVKERADALDATMAEIFAAGVEALEKHNEVVMS